MKKLRTEESDLNHHRLIVEEVNTGIILMDKNGELILANKKASEIFNTAMEELHEGKNIEHLWKTAWKITTEKGDPIPYEDAVFFKALQTGKAQSQTILLHSENGDNRSMRMHSQPLFNENNAAPFSVVSSFYEHHEEIAESIISAQEKERTNIGQELHDNVNQILVTAKLYLEILERGNGEAGAVAAKTKEFLVAAINEVTDISRSMVLPGFKEKDLIQSIHEMLNDITDTGLFKIDFCAEGNLDFDIPEGKKMALYRIAQEQMKNIIKHSQAKNVNVLLNIQHQAIQLLIEDDGIGFDASQKKKGIGLKNIYDRALLYDGTIRLKTNPGEGCSLHVAIPV